MSSNLTAGQILGYSSVETAGKPVVKVENMASAVAQAVCDNLPEGVLYRYRGEFVTVTVKKVVANDGSERCEVEKREMTAKRFCTWVEQWMVFERNEKVVSLGKPLAEAILASDYLRAGVPEISEIMPVRLPAWGQNAEGKRVLRILPAGYDPVTRIFSVETVKWDANKVYPVGVVIKAFEGALGTFPWGESEEEVWRKKRSVACFMAFMLGQFCRHLVGRQPMVLVIGNQPGTGKTLLAKFGLGPVYGIPNATPYPREEVSLQKLLFTKLMNGAPYVLIDDLASLASATLNQYATSEYISDRVLGGNVEFTGSNRMQLISTGNNLTVTADIERRSLIVDLFDVCKSTEKNVKNPLTERVFGVQSWREDMLTAMWSMVWAWSEAGCPKHVRASAMPSFEEFAEVVGSITVHSGFISPFTKRSVTSDGGDVRGVSLERLLKRLAELIVPESGKPHTGCSRMYSVDDVLEVAKSMGVLEIICSGKNLNQSMGHQLRKLKGREYVDGKGRRFTFGRKQDAVSSHYNVIILGEPAS